jgi:tRNA A-37 threonylcarbamoyl transferase component Bud32
MDVKPGDHIAGYRLEALLGEGGMGVVYRAVQDYPHRAVAIKLIAPKHSRDPLFRDRFIHETDAAASLDHPNIIPIYDAGEAGDVLYLVMRYVDGTDLRALLLRDGALDPPGAMSVAEQLGDALDAARSSGIIHRDVKPANVLLSPGQHGDRPHVYLTDFGVAKRLEGAGDLTNSGALVGTIDYMSPEQISGEAVDGSVDVYSLGCVIFHMLTGRPPFAGSTATVLWSHMNADVPLASAVNPSLPATVDGVLAGAMAKEPGDRYATCADLVADLRRAAAAGDTRPRHEPSDETRTSLPDVVAAPRDAARGPSRLRRARRPALLCLVVALVAGGIAFASWRSDGAAQPPGVPTYQLGVRATMIAGGAGTAWAAFQPSDGAAGSLVRLAYARSAWAGPYRLKAHPVGLAVTPDGVLVVEASGATTILETFDLGGRALGYTPMRGVTSCAARTFYYTCNPVMTPGAVWVPLRHSVIGVTRAGSVTKRVGVVGADPVAGLTADGNRLFIVAGQRIESVSTAAPGPTAHVFYQFPEGTRPQHLVAKGGLVWVSTLADDGASALALVTRDGVIRSIRVPGLQLLAIVGPQIWAGQGKPRQCNATGAVERFDLQTGARLGSPVMVGHQPGAMAFDGRSVWVVTFDPCTHVRRLARVPAS